MNNIENVKIFCTLMKVYFTNEFLSKLYICWKIQHKNITVRIQWK